MRPVAVTFLLLLAGCVTYGGVSAGRTSIGNGLSVEPTLVWSKRRAMMLIEDEIVRTNPQLEIWTQYGTGLDQLVFYAGVAPGETLLRGRVGRELPAFRADMSPSEIVELFEAMLVRGMKVRELERREVTTARFGARDGFRFRLSFAFDDDVDREMLTWATLADGRLYAIAWVATRLHYFERTLSEVERIVASARIAG
jgi:hypothetical protein